MQDGLANAPVQRNYRTNIVGSVENGGNILTSDLVVNVALDPLYDGEHNKKNDGVWEEYKGIYTEEALAGKTIEIPNGWHIRNGYILEPMPENWTAESSPLYIESYTVNGNDNTVTFEPYEYKFVTKMHLHQPIVNWLPSRIFHSQANILASSEVFMEVCQDVMIIIQYLKM